MFCSVIRAPFWRPAKESVVPGEIFYRHEVEKWVRHVINDAPALGTTNGFPCRGLQALIGETQHQPTEKHTAAISN